MIAISLDQAFAESGVSVRLGCVSARVEPRRTHEALERTLDWELSRLSRDLQQHPVSEVPQVAATRQAYRALGKDPSRYRPASEALLRRIMDGKGVPRVNTAVDTGNLISLRTGHAVGVYDLAAVSPPVRLRPGADGESYEAIGRGPFNLAHLPVLADARGPFGSPSSDSTRTMVSLRTRHVLLVLFAFGAAADLDRDLGLAAASVGAYLDGQQVESAVIAPRAP